MALTKRAIVAGDVKRVATEVERLRPEWDRAREEYRRANSGPKQSPTQEQTER